MNKVATPLSLLVLLLFSGCFAKNPKYIRGRFNVSAGYEFVNQIDILQSIQKISIIDTRADGNEFSVNEQNIFLDTSRTDMPNFYSYLKRAKEINVDKDALLKALRSFYKVGVNEFRRKDGYYLFPVVTSLFTTERGQIDQKWFEYKAAE